MSKTLYRSRQSAYIAQAGLCFYCRYAMWLHSAGTTLRHKKKPAKRLQCTAEHLIPRNKGGSHLPENIVAACLHCNSTRHKRKTPPTAEKYLTIVRSRIAKGKWHPKEIGQSMYNPQCSVYYRDILDKV